MLAASFHFCSIEKRDGIFPRSYLFTWYLLKWHGHFTSYNMSTSCIMNIGWHITQQLHVHFLWIKRNLTFYSIAKCSLPVYWKEGDILLKSYVHFLCIGRRGTFYIMAAYSLPVYCKEADILCNSCVFTSCVLEGGGHDTH